MRLLIWYFSGTGNTHYVATYLADKLAHLPTEIRLRSIEQRPAKEVGDFDLLAVGFPVYACDAPDFFRDELERLPPGEGRGVFIFCTKGAYAGKAGRRNLQRLASRGYTPLGEASVVMPGTDGIAFISKTSWLARWAEGKDYGQLKSADKLARRIEEVVRQLQAGVTVQECALQLPANLHEGPFDRLWRMTYERFTTPFKQRFYADERCNHCLLCVKICPSGNIAFRDNRIHYAGHCYLCMRCVHQCPQEAVQIGEGTVGKFRWRGPRGVFKPLRLYGRILSNDNVTE